MIFYFAAAEQRSHRIQLTTGGAKSVLMVVWNHFKDDTFWEGIDRCSFKDIFIDSGAWSAWSRGVEINIQEYCDWIKRHRKRITTYANLDVIGDYRETRRNQKYMERQGLKPIPIFHLARPAEPWFILKSICNNYSHIGIGGVASHEFTRTQKRTFFDRCWKIIGQYHKRGKKIKVHAFGIGAMDFVERYPWYSVDFTTWLVGQKMGEINHFDGRRLKRYKAKQSAIVKFGDPDLVDTKKRKGSDSRAIYNVRSMSRYQKFVTAMWKKRGITWAA